MRAQARRQLGLAVVRFACTGLLGFQGYGHLLGRLVNLGAGLVGLGGALLGRGCRRGGRLREVGRRRSNLAGRVGAHCAGRILPVGFVQVGSHAASRISVIQMLSLPS